jgi:hypothetical protein
VHVPKYTVPSLPIAGDDLILLPVRYLHLKAAVEGPAYEDRPVPRLLPRNLGQAEVARELVLVMAAGA